MSGWDALCRWASQERFADRPIVREASMRTASNVRAPADVPWRPTSRSRTRLGELATNAARVTTQSRSGYECSGSCLTRVERGRHDEALVERT